MIPQLLFSEIYKKRCLLFLGAGFSLNADVTSGKMPDMKELGKLLSLDTQEKSNNVLEIASIYEKELGRPNLIKKLSELLHVDDVTPGIVHKKLAEMDTFDTIVTTNFEFLLERALHAQNKHVNVIIGDKNISTYSPSTTTNIIKIHGDLNQTDEIVITKEDYASFSTNHPVLSIHMAAWFTTKLPLFIGYSLCDPHFLEIRNLLKQMLGKFLNPWFIVKFDATKDEIENARKDSLIIINLETRGRSKRDTLLDFFVQIQEYINAKNMKLPSDSVASIQYDMPERIDLSNKVELKLDGSSFSIPYSIQGARLEGLYVTIGTNVMSVNINTFADGNLWIRIPRNVLDAVTDGNDDSFFVICDGAETDFTEKTSKDERELVIPFQKGTQEIVIVGTTTIGQKTITNDANTIEILEGSSTPKEDEKYLRPQTLIIKKGQKVTWVNYDIAAHTITSGTPEEGPNGLFDSSLIKSGVEFEHLFEEKGTYRYHCLVHPWKEGKIIVVD